MNKSVLGALSNKGAPSERFFGEVVSYADDASSVQVKVLGTDQVRTVVMNDDDIKVKEGQARPGIANFAGRGKQHTDVGGVLLVEDAKPQGGQWQARWVSTAMRTPTEGAVLEGPMRVGPIRNGSNDKPYRAVDVLLQDSARRVETAGELRTALAASMASSGAAVVRVAEYQEGGNYGIRTVFANGGVGDAEPEAKVAQAIEKNERLSKLIAATSDGGVDGATTAIEVVPSKRFFFGADAGQSERLDMLFTRESKKNEGERYSKGFGQSMLVLRSSDDGYQFAINAMPKAYSTQFTQGGPFATEGGRAVEAKVKAAWQAGREAAADNGAEQADGAAEDWDLTDPPVDSQRAAAGPSAG